ncbi:MAG: hypothetical protein IJ789_08800 [Bacteroidales bacterium]|nr:hypothetical protein [Bacteroidales bacterium]
MKRFVLDTAIVLLIVLVALTVIDVAVPLHGQEYEAKANHIKEHGNEISTLIVGNSLATAGVDACVFGDSCYCDAIAGEVLYYTMKRLEQDLPRMSNLRAVILPLHYNLLAYQYFGKLGAHFIYNYYRSMNITLDTFPYGYLYRLALPSGKLHLSSRGCDYYNPQGNSWPNWTWNGEKQEENPPNQCDEVDIAIDYLTAMARMCHERGVRFIVVVPPFPDAWLEGCTEDGMNNLQIIADSVNALYPIGFHNYMADSQFRDRSLYMNWNHLSHAGGTLFAQRIKEDFGL